MPLRTPPVMRRSPVEDESASASTQSPVDAGTSTSSGSSSAGNVLYPPFAYLTGVATEPAGSPDLDDQVARMFPAPPVDDEEYEGPLDVWFPTRGSDGVLLVVRLRRAPVGPDEVDDEDFAWACPLCNAPNLYPSVEAVVAHGAAVHAGQYFFACGLCEVPEDILLSFPTATTLLTHVRAMHGAPPYPP